MEIDMEKLIRHPGRIGEGIRQNSACISPGEELEYLTFPGLEKIEGVRHLVTTRRGGVSRGAFSSMNLSFTRGDNPEDVAENYRRIGQVLDCPPERMAASRQSHTTHIRRVGEEDAGKGVVFPCDYADVDGLITDVPRLALVTFYADCVPLLFVDGKRRVIGAAHSGWRGTADRMGACMTRALGEAFGTKPQDLFAAIGPSICQSCYQVSRDVAQRFFPLDGEETKELRRAAAVKLYGQERLLQVAEPDQSEPGKYRLDLWLANLLILMQAGIPAEQIFVTDLCTCHNSGYLFSHRVSAEKRGNLAAFLMLN